VFDRAFPWRLSNRAIAACAGLALLALTAGVRLATAASDSLTTDHDEADSFVVVPPGWGEGRNYTPLATEEPGTWLRTPFGENLLTDPAAWDDDRTTRIEPLLDYNRVDQLRLGIRYQAQAPDTRFPRLGARYEYA